MSDILEEVKRTPLHGRQKVSLVILGLVILISGFLLGSSTTFYYLKDQMPPRRFPPTRMEIIERLSEELGLTDQQRDKVKAIIEKADKAFQEMWGESAKKMEAARDQMVEEMKEVLTAEQYDKWLMSFTEREQDRKQRVPPRLRDRGRDDRGGRGRPWDGRMRGPRPGGPPDPNRAVEPAPVF